MKIVVLIDNNQHPTLNLCHEHGLSVYFEVEGEKWLFDVGASSGFYTNAENLGISIEDVDHLVISHGHADHTGGLEKFLLVNSKADIMMSAQIKDKSFYSYRRQSKRDISIDFKPVEQYINRFIFIEKNTQISEQVGLICEFSACHPRPKANASLFISSLEGEKQDDFNHEIALTINTTDGLIVFSGCSHNGILNTLSACTTYSKNSDAIACIGGTHFVDKDTGVGFESESDIQQTANILKSSYPNMILYTGHCTGSFAAGKLAAFMGKSFNMFYTGNMIEI